MSIIIANIHSAMKAQLNDADAIVNMLITLTSFQFLDLKRWLQEDIINFSFLVN